MGEHSLIAVLGFVALFGLMGLRVPIGFAMGLVGFGGFALLNGLDPALRLFSHSPLRTATSYALEVIPLFILMGSLAAASGISRELFTAGAAWLGHRRGGLALSTVAACGGFAAICGSSVATVATMGKIALPAMREAGYSSGLSTGVIAAGGTLGIMIPPSIALALYGLMTEQDISRLFVAGIVPGLLGMLMYMVPVQIIAWLNPASAPRLPAVPWRARFASLRGLWATGLLFALVIGGMYGGVFTPTEAAGVGAVAMLLMGILRGRLNLSLTVEAVVDALRTSAAVFVILIGAAIFGYFITITQTPQRFSELIGGLGLGPYGTLVVLLAFLVVLGCFLDALAMIVLTVPIMFPIVVGLGFDPIWFGVIVVVTIELALITPPIGLNVFVLRSVAGDVSIGRIFQGVLPFIVMDVLRLALLSAVPALVLFLPNTM